MSAPLSGGCLCGDIRYDVDCEVKQLAACYCRDCQRATGAGGSINARVPARAFRLTRGQTKIFTKKAESGNDLHRHFCGNCGSWIYNPMGGDPAHLILKAGTFDRHDGMEITLNVWTESRTPWALMDPDIAAHDKQ